MAGGIEPVRLQATELARAGEVLGRAFYDDPMTMFVFPDDAHREQVLPGFFATGVRYGFPHGETYTGAGMPAVAVWIPPGAADHPPDDSTAAAAAARDAAMGADATRRFQTVIETWNALHARDMSMPHWYLMILGVDPPLQGRGIGGQLIQPVLARADAEGHPCYLETAKARNVAFYQKHGFEVLVEDEMPGAGFRYWTMRRPPRT